MNNVRGDAEVSVGLAVVLVTGIQVFLSLLMRELWCSPKYITEVLLFMSLLVVMVSMVVVVVSMNIVMFLLSCEKVLLLLEN